MNDIDLRIERMLQLSADLLEQQRQRAAGACLTEEAQGKRAEAPACPEHDPKDSCF